MDTLGGCLFWGWIFALWRQCRSKKSSFDLRGRPQSKKLIGTWCQEQQVGDLQIYQLKLFALSIRRESKKWARHGDPRCMFFSGCFLCMLEAM